MLDHVFSPVRIGKLELAHRIMMGSMHLNLETVDDGSEWATFYTERVRGGVDLVVTGGIAVNETGAGSRGYAVLTHAEDRARLARVADAVHAAGGRIALQLFHAGRYAFPDAFGITPLAPSAVYSRFSRCMPEAMTEADIEATLADFAAGAYAAVELGFDALEVMGSEGYLINQFASPVTNQRDDDWGGSAKARQRFPVAVLTAVRHALGPDFPLIARTSGDDLVSGSSSHDELDAVAVALAAAGADAINVGIGWHESRTPTVQALVPHGMWVASAARIRRALHAAGYPIPVIGSNRINSLAQAEAFLATDEVDMISMARPFLADPDIIAKSRADRPAFVNTCIGCNQACIDRSFGHERVSCLVNPRAGHELAFPLPASSRRRGHVAVVGAGPAGMQAAATLARHGINVDLFEAESRIGGQFRLACQVPGKTDYGETIRYFEHELARLGVHIHTSTRATAATLGNYDHVIVAAGVTPRRIDMPGIDLPHVMTYSQAFDTPAAVGYRVAMIGAGGIAVDLAERLANTDNPSLDGASARDRFARAHKLTMAGSNQDTLPCHSAAREITIMRRSGRIGAGVGPSTRWAVVASIRAAGVKTLSGVDYRRITPEGIWISPPADDANPHREEELIRADTIIIAAGQEPDRRLADALQAAGMAHTVIGGALDTARLNAVRAFEQGLRAATRIATAT